MEELDGKIYNYNTNNSINYQVYSQNDLLVLINHFDKYPLITQKLADYNLFKQAFELIQRKEHLTLEGLHKIVGIKTSINLGLSDSLKIAFPGVVPVVRPLVKNNKVIDPN